ncbi:MAG: chemotaxis protein CheB [Methylibium sp.]|uniref:chemotaxis protein CheB n=1 Tax=Methylibium sp. TaxID=2067992 RepID=UPI0017A225C5|nr:chemotaxis protein CheB [Methylibium sp.]MBA3597019.1 chemotaxis protein CheB [Methylibium sp.]
MNQIVVIGASAGGVKALTTLAHNLPRNFPAALVVVLHVGSYRSVLPGILTRAGPLPATHARHEERVEPGRIYVAPPDHHLLLADERLQLSRGAKEHHSRPAIDPLFRSAALAYGPGAIGVVLTGRLDDGTAGLQAIKECGGTAIVQDPDEAEAPDMPASACRFVNVDHCVALAALPELLVTLTKRAPAAAHQPQRQWPAHEQAILLAEGDPMEHLGAIATPSSFVCPDCHGSLWEIVDAQPRRFRCHTGHAFTIRTLQDTLATTSDESLWSARRALQERLLLLREMKRSVEPETIPHATIESAVSQLQHQLNQLERLMEQAPDPLE